MKKIACLLAIMMLLFPSLALSQRKLDPTAAARARNAKWDRLAADLAVLFEVSKPLRKYYSDLFKVDLDNSPMAADVFARMMPNYTRYLRQTMLQRHGIDISFVFSAKTGGAAGDLPPQLVRFGSALWMLTLVGTGYMLIDEFSERYIVQDLQQTSMTHDQAIAAAEHITNEGTIEAGRFIDSVCVPHNGAPCGVAEGLARLLVFIESIRDAKDYDPDDYDPNEGFIPNGAKPPGFRSFPDDGGSVTGRFLGTPGPGQGAGQNPNVSLGCWIYGPIYVDPVTGVVVEGWYTIPC